MTGPSIRRSSPLAFLLLAALAVTGCGTANSGSMGAVASSAQHALTGSVHGAQQPVAGASIALYAAGKTGTASAARSMLTASVSSNASGQFDLSAPGLFSCNAGDQVYLVATGGNSGSGPNNAIALMAALGPYANLLGNSSVFINVNEVTTVGSVFALASFMSGIPNVGSSTAQANQLAGAFANTQTLVNTSNGAALTVSTGNGIVPQTTINSLANSISSCINSTQGSTQCSQLFAATSSGGSTPSDTVGATLNVALNPTANPSGIYLLGTPAATFQPTLASAPASYAITVQHPSDVLMYHNNISRNGVQTYEQTLTPANVNSTSFGKLYTFPVDSYLFAQPLYIGGVGMPDGKVHNIVFAASSRGTVYAFDADGNNPAAGYLWSVNYIPSGERYPAASDYGGCGNPPEAGIVGTPVIDRAHQTLYFVVKSITTTGSTFYHRLHAVSLLDGSEQPSSPQVISPSFTGTGAGASAGSVPWNGQRQNNRSALLIAPNGSGGTTVWIAYASHCDAGPYHGILLGYDAASLNNIATFINTPNGSDGGIWGSSGGPAADANGNVYLLGGNGTFDANTSGHDFGDSALRLTPPASASASTLLTPADYFTPSNQATLSSSDLDLGGAEGLLFSDPASGVAPNLLVASDKNGYVYLLNAANLGKYDTGSHGIDGLNGDLQDFGGSSTFIYNFSFFNNTLYTSNPMRAYTYTPGTGSTAGSFNTTPAASLSVTAAPVVSANGASNGIVWAESTSGVMYATSAGTLTQLYTTSQASGGRDTAPTFVKFTSPVIANGKVYLSGQGSLAVYGELP